MSTRKPTLEEWFLAYQLRAIGKRHFHLPIFLEADVSAIVERYRARGARPSYTALAIKALALTARAVPAINRCYFPTVLGDKVVEFDHISVNLPVLLREDGREHLIAETVRDADRKSVAEIHQQVRAAQKRTLAETKIAKFVARKPNNLFWRGALKAVHFAAYNLPAIEKLGGGGLSVSSVITHRDEGVPHARTVAMGPTAVSLGVTGVRTDGARVVLEMGMGLDHAAVTGIEARRATDALYDLFTSKSPEVLACFD